MTHEKEQPIPAENPNVRAIVHALAEWIAHRRASKDYGSLVGEIEDVQTLYENGQSGMVVVVPAGLPSRAGRRAQS